MRTSCVAVSLRRPGPSTAHRAGVTQSMRSVKSAARVQCKYNELLGQENPMPDALMLARMQFAANITFHILFPTLSIGLCWLLVYFRSRHARTA